MNNKFPIVFIVVLIILSAAVILTLYRQIQGHEQAAEKSRIAFNTLKLERTKVAQNADTKKLNGIESACAGDIGLAVVDAISSQSLSDLSKLLSLSGAIDGLSTIGVAIQTELHACIVNVYRLGIEDGINTAIELELELRKPPVDLRP